MLDTASVDLTAEFASQTEGWPLDPANGLALELSHPVGTELGGQCLVTPDTTGTGYEYGDFLPATWPSTPPFLDAHHKTAYSPVPDDAPTPGALDLPDHLLFQSVAPSPGSSSPPVSLDGIRPGRLSHQPPHLPIDSSVSCLVDGCSKTFKSLYKLK